MFDWNPNCDYQQTKLKKKTKKNKNSFIIGCNLQWILNERKKLHKSSEMIKCKYAVMATESNRSIHRPMEWKMFFSLLETKQKQQFCDFSLYSLLVNLQTKTNVRPICVVVVVVFFFVVVAVVVDYSLCIIFISFFSMYCFLLLLLLLFVNKILFVLFLRFWSNFLTLYQSYCKFYQIKIWTIWFLIKKKKTWDETQYLGRILRDSALSCSQSTHFALIIITSSIFFLFHWYFFLLFVARFYFWLYSYAHKSVIMFMTMCDICTIPCICQIHYNYIYTYVLFLSANTHTHPYEYVALNQMMIVLRLQSRFHSSQGLIVEYLLFLCLIWYI